jgi:1,4-dihydroxy-2-naphthoate octaprenyltransferase
MTPTDIRLFLRLSRPLYLLCVALLYILGAGIVRYLGEPIEPDIFWLGLIWLFFIQLSAHYLYDYFLEKPILDDKPHSPFSSGSGALGPGKLPRQTALWAAFAALAGTASFTALILQQVFITPSTTLVLVVVISGVLLYTIPPFRLAASGYGELLISILVANMVPAWAFLLQTGEFHRLLAMSTFPLTALHLAMVIAFDLTDFGRDVKYEYVTLLVRMGWREGMNLHNLLILSAYLMLGLAAFYGLPPAIALPAILTLPLGLLQIWQMTRISAGGKPNWRTLHLTAVALFLATSYLLTYSFWTR